MRVFVVSVFLGVVAALLIYLLGFTSRKEMQSSYQLFANFKNTGGIKAGAPITLAGLEIGSIKNIELNQKRRSIKAELAIRNGVFVPNDSKLKITEKGMLGEMYLAFEFGKSKESYAEGELIEGETPFSLTDLMGTAGGTVEDVGQELVSLAKSINQIMSDEKFQDGVKNTVGELPGLIKQISNTVGENKGTINEILQKLKSVLEGVEKTVSYLSGKIASKETDDLLINTRKLIKNTNEISAKINGEISPVLESGKDLSKNLVVVSSKAEKVMDELNNLLNDLNRSKGTGGMILKDDRLYENANAMVKNAKDFLEILKEKPSAIIWGKKRKSEKIVRKKRSRIGFFRKDDGIVVKEDNSENDDE